MNTRALASVCAFCAGWELPRNCGHGLINGQLAPDSYFGAHTLTLEIGQRAATALARSTISYALREVEDPDPARQPQPLW